MRAIVLVSRSAMRACRSAIRASINKWCQGNAKARRRKAIVPAIEISWMVKSKSIRRSGDKVGGQNRRVKKKVLKKSSWEIAIADLVSSWRGAGVRRQNAGHVNGENRSLTPRSESHIGMTCSERISCSNDEQVDAPEDGAKSYSACVDRLSEPPWGRKSSPGSPGYTLRAQSVESFPRPVKVGYRRRKRHRFAAVGARVAESHRKRHHRHHRSVSQPLGWYTILTMHEEPDARTRESVYRWFGNTL